MELSSEILSALVIYAKYAKFLPEKGRRENWNEIVDRNLNMHLRKFPELELEIRDAYRTVYDKIVLSSLRAMQFSGKAIEINPVRQFNCSATAINSVEVFSEIMFLLLSGSGVGISVQGSDVEKLPPVRHPLPRRRRYLVGDSICGWSDAIKVLMEAYFYGKSDPDYDFRDIREKGMPLLTSGGKAPGPAPLKHCIYNLRKVLDGVAPGEKLRPIDAHDLVCHIADAVLSGGIRRASIISLFSLDDIEMLTCKSGDWFEKHPHRGRANNSAVILRHRVKKKDFMKLWDRIKNNGTGEPAIFFSNSSESLTNPCQPGWATVMTPNGVSTINQVSEGDLIWTGKRFAAIQRKTFSGNKEVNEYRTTAGMFIGTSNHRVFSNGEKIEAGSAKTIDIATVKPPFCKSLDGQDVMDGLVLGDGMMHKASNNLIVLCVGRDDQDYFKDSSLNQYFLKDRHGLNKTAWEIKTSFDNLKRTFEREVPERFLFGSSRKIRGFLRGLYSANGSTPGDRISLKSSSFSMINSVQIMLSSLGIRSYYTTNHPKNVTFPNGTYKCKRSYDLNIRADRELFRDLIGFIQEYKNAKLAKICETKLGKSGTPKSSYEVRNIVSRGTHDVYDITVDAEEHSYWTGGLLVANCGEASLNVGSGGQMCNLCEINAGAIKTQTDLNAAAKAAAFIGTLQASYTDFHYLRSSWKKMVEKEALLGVGITGLADRNFLKLDLEEAASVCVAENRRAASLIGIKPAARITLVKPSGTSSLVLGTSSGIHAWHSKHYIRRLRFNKNEPLYLFLKEKLPELVEDDYEKPSLGAIVSIPIKAPEGAVLRDDETALDLLERVKFINQKWIAPGHVSGNNMHNVSCTVSLRDDEWGTTGQWLWKNREFYTGISVLPYFCGEYKQMPLEEIDAETYEKMLSSLTKVSLDEIVESEDRTDLKAEAACSGGQCEIRKL